MPPAVPFTGSSPPDRRVKQANLCPVKPDWLDGPLGRFNLPRFLRIFGPKLGSRSLVRNVVCSQRLVCATSSPDWL